MSQSWTYLALLLCLLFSCKEARKGEQQGSKYRAVKSYNAQTGGVSLIIQQEGKTILEDYPNGGHPDSTWLLASGTKGFMGVIVAAAVQDGIISSIDENLSESLEEWQEDTRKQLSLRQLLTLSSGLETQKGGPQSTLTYKESLELPLQASPGSRYAYGPTPFQTFGEFMLRKLRDHPYPSADQYLQARIFDKLGIEVAKWWREADNNPRLASGAYMRARDWAIFGQFVLAKGKWKGEQLVDTKTFEQIFQGTEANPAYGFGWWLNEAVSPKLISQQDDFVKKLMEYTQISEKLPEDFFFALGGGNQRLYLIPSMDLVVIRQQKVGPNSRTDDFEPFSDLAFLKHLLNLDLGTEISEAGKEALDKYLSENIETEKLPLSALAIANKTHILYQNFQGFGDTEAKLPIHKKSIFGIRSMTKPITTVAILQLVEKGIMELDAPIGNYLPAYQDMALLDSHNPTDGSYISKAPQKQPTIRHLLSHTSGITYGLFDTLANNIYVKKGGKGAVPNWEELPLMFEPGSKWSYGMGHRLCGWALEKLTGQSLEEYCQQHIFEPLGMHNTQWVLKESQKEQLSKLFEKGEKGWQESKWPAAYAQAIRGDGGIFSTLEDYTIFAQMLLNEGSYQGQQILSPGSLKEMRSNQIGDLTVGEMQSAVPFLSKKFPTRIHTDKFGLGVLIKSELQKEEYSKEAGSFGWDGLLNTYFWVDPDSEISVLFFTQLLPFFDPQSQEVLHEVEKIIYKHLGT